MSYYRRKRYVNNNWREQQKVTVHIMWDNVTNATYTLKFDNIGSHWKKCEPIIELIKASIPSSQREWVPEIKTWYIGEAFIKPIKDICEQIPEFDVIWVEKPEGVKATKFHSHEDDYAEFKRLVSFAHVEFDDTTDLSVITKIFRKAAMLLHPDRSPETSDLMSSLNEVFTRLKDPNQPGGAYFK